MLMDQRASYCLDINSPQIGLKIQGNPNQNPAVFFGSNQQFRIYIDSQRPWNSQSNLKKDDARD